MPLRNRIDSSRTDSIVRKRLPSVALLFLMTFASVTSAEAGILDTIKSLAAQARSEARAAKDSANDLRSKVVDGVKHLTGEVRMMIEEKIEDVKSQIDIVLEERELYSDRCESFREELIDTMVGIQSMAETVQDLLSCEDDADLEPMIDLEREIALVERIPCRLLVPLAKIRFTGCFGERLRDGAEALKILKDFRKDSRKALDTALENVEEVTSEAILRAKLAASRVWRVNYKVAVLHQRNLELLGNNLNLAAQLVQALGTTGFEASIGIHGYPSITLSATQAEKVSGILSAYGKFVTDFAAVVKGLISDAENVSFQELLLRNQLLVMDVLAVGEAVGE